MSGAGVVGRLARIRRGALLALVLGLPLAFLQDVTNLTYDAPKLALLLTATAVAAAARAGEALLGAPAGGLRRAALPAALLVVPVAVAWLATGYKSWSLLGSYARYEGLVPILSVVTAGVLLAEAFAPDYRVLARSLVASAGLVGAFALIQSVGLDPFGEPVVDYAASTIGHPNFLGGFLAISLPVALGLVTSSAGRERYAAMAAVVAIVLGIVLSFSQGGWVAAAAGIALFGGMALSGRFRRARAVGWLAAAALAAAAAGIVLLSMVDPFNPAVPDTTRARGFWWRAAVSMGSESPVWGHGPNVYAIEGPHHRTAADALAHDTMYADEPHSVPLGLFANAGALGLGGFAALVVWTVRRSLALPGDPVRQGFAAGAGAYFVQSLVSIDTMTLALAAWVCLAALTRDREATDATAPSPAAWRKAVALTLLIVVAAGALAWSGRYLWADSRVLAADEAFRGRRTEDALDALRSALRLRDDHHYRHLYAAMLAAAALREGAEGADEIDRMRAAFAYLDDFPELRALSDFGDGFHQWSIYDRRLEADALRVFRRALSLDEHSPTLRVLTAESLLRLGRADEAVTTLEAMVPSMEEYPELVGSQPKLWGALAIANFFAGSPEEAAAALERAQSAGETTGLTGDCHLLAARELLRRSGEQATRAEYVETSRGLLLCRPATVALLPGFDPHVEDEAAR